MTKLFLSLHVLAAILAIGPVTVAASMFPRYARPPVPEQEGADGHDISTAGFLHRICSVYTRVAIAVPVLGLATGATLGVLTDAWLLASVALTTIAGGVLLLSILPGQRRLLWDNEPVMARRSAAARLAMTTGIFNLLWATVVVLMVVRPGSTTGT